MVHSVYFALGARDGDPLDHLRFGLARISAAGLPAERLSSVWETEPVNLPPGGPVYNAAAWGRTLLAPERLLELFHLTEEAAGRRRGADPWRSLDLDILMVDSLVLHGPGLELPHPRFHARRFNLAPLAEIAPGAVHPVLGASIADLLARCADPSWVRRLDEPTLAPALHPPGASGKIQPSPRAMNLPPTRRAPHHP